VGYNTNGREVEGFDETYPLDDLMDHVGGADILINILPSTEATVGLLTDGHFDEMKNDSVFVNIGRGDIAADEVLLNTLEQPKIGGDRLDASTYEPRTE